MASEYTQATARLLSESTILDFGCGWGRLLRLLPYFTDPKNIYGSDAWDVSLNYAKTARILATLGKTDPIPTALPFPGVRFDLIYPFSVFTHLSEAVARACVSTMRKYISPDGLAIITVRPLEFWTVFGQNKKADFSNLENQHRSRGFAYRPHSEREQNYGDTSISRNFLVSLAPGWEIMRMGNTLVDMYQVLVCLRPY